MMMTIKKNLLARSICRLLRSNYQYGAWRGCRNSMSQKQKLLWPHQSGASQISWNIMYECYGSKKKAPKNVSFLPPLHHATSHSTNATPPSQTFHRLCAIVFAQTLRKLKAIEKSQHPQKIHNIFLHTNVFHSNLDRSFKILQPSSWTCNYFIDPSTHFWGDPISITFIFSINY